MAEEVSSFLLLLLLAAAATLDDDDCTVLLSLSRIAVWPDLLVITDGILDGDAS